MKKGFSLLLSFILVFNIINVTAFALSDANQSCKVITYEEYIGAIQEEFAAYGIEWYAKETTSPAVFTQKELDEALEQVHSYVESHLAAQEAAFHEFQELSQNGELKEDDLLVSPKVLYHTYYDLYDDTFVPVTTIPILYTFCTIRTTVDILTDLQNYYIISPSNVRLQVRSGTGIGTYCELQSYQCSYSNQNTTSARINFLINCTVMEELTIGVVTSWSYVDVSYTTSFRPFPQNL